MKKLILKMSAALAALTCAASVLASVPASAAWISTDDSAQQWHTRFPKVYENEEYTFYSNWDSEQAYKLLYWGKKPYSKITAIILPNGETDQDTLIASKEQITASVRAVVEPEFDDSYEIGVIDVGYYPESKLIYEGGMAWSVQISDSQQRPETEAKCDRLFEILKEQYSVLEIKYEMSIERYEESYNLETWLCSYIYRPDRDMGIKEPDGGEKLKTLIAEKYPDWEVQESESEQAMTYAVRKKGCTLYEVPIEEYLEVSDTIKKELGYYEFQQILPDEVTISTQTKYYVGGTGDLNRDDERTVADAVLLSRCVAEDTEAPVTDKGLKEADLDCDGLLTVNDTCQLLDMLAAWK